MPSINLKTVLRAIHEKTLLVGRINAKREVRKSKNVQCCHIFPARSPVFLAASAPFFPQVPKTSFTVFIASAKNYKIP